MQTATTSSDDTLWSAFVQRDASYNGHVYACVRSTRIYCLFTCSARKPKRENVSFMRGADTCKQAGYRACLRCRPDRQTADTPPWVRQLRDAVRADPEARWSEARLRTEGFSPSTVRRAFQRYYGQSFAGFVRENRLQRAHRSIRRTEAVITAQLEAGYESSSGYRTALKRSLGVKPKEIATMTPLFSQIVATPIGDMISVVDEHHVRLLEFTDRNKFDLQLRSLLSKQSAFLVEEERPAHGAVKSWLTSYFEGDFSSEAPLIAPSGTSFQEKVWRGLQAIPVGETRSYGQLAKQLGDEKAVRALASANARNALAIIIPCHRVIGADGGMTGYAGGIWRKNWLLRHEGAIE